VLILYVTRIFAGVFDITTLSGISFIREFADPVRVNYVADNGTPAFLSDG
jgi:hypothetical protein